jgi:hypothetical protein
MMSSVDLFKHVLVGASVDFFVCVLDEIAANNKKHFKKKYKERREEIERGERR